MEAEAPVVDLERRKQVRLRVRSDLNVTPQVYEGRTYYVVKDPVSLRYYRFKEQEYFLLNLMNGEYTNDQAQKEFEKRFRPDRLTLEDLEHFSQQLLTAGLVQNESPQAGKQLFDRRKKRKRMELMRTFTNLLYIKVPVFDPEKLLKKMLPYTRWIFTLSFLFVSLCFMLGAVLLVLTHFETFYDRLPSYQEFFSFKSAVYLWAALGVVKVIHEFGHGLSCKAFGGEVHEMGFLLLCLSPAMYCNVSDAWTLPNKWRRIVISGAGIYVELMIASAATFIWWNTPSHPFVNYLSLSLMIVCSVSTVFFNGNPLMRYDGYYVLADWLEIPNLRDRANKYLQRLAMEYCLGMETQPEAYMELSRRILFVIYAIISWVYRWAITFVILKFMSTFLKPYRLEIISNLFALAAFGGMIGWPVYSVIKNIRKRGRLPDMKPIRVTITATLIGAFLVGFFFLPLPVTRVRQPGLVEIQPSYLEPVYLQIGGGILQKIYVKEGEFVKKDKILAVFSSLDVENRYEEARNTVEAKLDLLRKYSSSQGSKAREASQKRDLAHAQVEAFNELSTAKSRLNLAERDRKLLTLVAPRDGVVIGLPLVDEIGKRWDMEHMEQGVPFCKIGDPTKLRILVPLSPPDYELVRENLKRLKDKGKEEVLPVTIRVQGRAGDTWTGRLSNLPEQQAPEIPMSLSNRGGGPLAVKQGSKDGHIVPQSDVYLVGINFDDPDRAIAAGTLGQVKIHCEYRSAAWWAWHTLSAMFDLRLSF